MDTPAPQVEAKSEDKYDAMALISGPIAGLRPEQLPGLAHIFRQIAKDEREACARLADKTADYASERLAASPFAKSMVEEDLLKLAAEVRHTAQHIAVTIRNRKDT